MQQDKLSIRKVRPDDFEGLVQLYEKVWPEVDYDKRKKTHYILNESIGINYCVEWNGRIVGSRMSLYQNMLWGMERIKCVQLTDSCISPDCRGKGLFQKMDIAFLNEFFGEDVKGVLIYNISVIASRRAHEKLGWHYIESLQKLRKFPNPMRTLWRMRLHIKNIHVPLIWEKKNDVPQIDDCLLQRREQLLRKCGKLHIFYDITTFYSRMKSESGIRIFHDDTYGCVIYKLGHRGNLVEVELGEMFLYEYTERTFKKLLKTFEKVIKPDILWVMVSEGHPLRKYYGNSWFLSNPKQKYLHHGVRVETDEMKKICYNSQNWAISSLDIDTF